MAYETVSLDLEYLRKKAEATMLEQRRNVALEHQEACDVYRYLLKKAIEQFDKADNDGNDDRKERLYPIIESINANLVAARSTRDLVESEIKDSREKANKLGNELKIIAATATETRTTTAAAKATRAWEVQILANDKASRKSD